MIKIRQPLCFSEIGRKDNQEDALYPAHADRDTRVFVLCDGMGGHDNGEVASATAAEALGDYLSSLDNVDIPTFQEALATAYDALDAIDTKSAKKPGTTMTCLCLNEDSYLVAHIGDSRIYHIRPSLFDPNSGRGGILYQSSDHSLVNDLLKAGEITESEARDFPQKNIITRAMQPHLPKRYSADVYMLDDVKKGDYFFLCCDGVLEQLSNEQLCAILVDKHMDDAGKLQAIKAVCDGRTRDNYTCWLIPVDKVSFKTKTDITQTIIAETDDSAGIRTKIHKIKNRFSIRKFPSIPKRYLLWILWIIVAAAVFFGSYEAYRYFVKPKGAAETENSVIEKGDEESLKDSIESFLDPNNA